MPTEVSAYLRKPMPPSLRAYLWRKIAYERIVFAGRLVAMGIAGGLIWLLAAAMLDRMLALGLPARVFAIGVEVAFLGLILFLIIRNFFHRADFLRAAASVEPEFDQRLETLVSQWRGPNNSDASQPIIDELWRSVEIELPAHPAGATVSWGRLIAPWTAAGMTILLTCLLSIIPGVGLPQLFARLFHPRSNIVAVTTTRLDVSPGDVQIIEQSPVTIRVKAQRLGRMPPVIHFSSDKVAFAKAVMSPGNGAFVWGITSAQKDFSYYVTGGDARSRMYRVTLLVPPAISELRVRYEYPGYTHHDPLMVTTHAGPIEAPQGTRVGLDIVSLTPLSEAKLQIGSKTLIGSATKSPNIRHVDFVLDHDATAQLLLIGSNGVPSKQEISIPLDAIPDQPPLVQLLQPSADIHLTPRDLMTIAWQALDDFGVEKLQLQWQINNEPPHQIPLPTSGDPRRCVGTVDIDLANMPLKIGDILAVGLLADDGAGHESRTPMRHIAISPRSVDIDTYLRLSALHGASDLSTTLLNALHLSIAVSPRADQFNQNLAAAADAVALLRQSILQAIQHTRDTQTMIAISNIGDRVAMIASAIEQSQNAPNMDRLKQATDLAQQIQVELGLITQGEQAAIVLADRANVREISSSAQSDPQLRARLEETLARANEEAEQGAVGLGISPRATDMDHQLEDRMRAGDQIVEAMKPVDLLTAANDWSRQMSDPQHAPRELAHRLEMAADLEGARKNGQAVWARDLLLAGRAAHRIEETALHDPIVSRGVLAKMIADYPLTLEALYREHISAGPNAGAALAQMKLWAAEPDMFTSAEDVLNRPVAQDLAMEANARMAEHDYAGAAAIDAQLADTPEGRQARQNIVAAARQMRTAEKVDQVNVAQRALSAQTVKPERSAVLARDQEKLAQRIEQVRQSDETQAPVQNSRDQAMATVLKAQQKLAQMPAGLEEGNKVAKSNMQSADVAAIGNELSQFTPETADAVTAIRQNLVPALDRFNQAKQSTEVKTAAGLVRSSIAVVQQALARTQEQFTQQDPLVAAKWYAEAAAVELSRKPPNLSAAHAQQSNLFRALHSAWQTAVHQASLDRLAGSETINSPLPTPAVPQAITMPTMANSSVSEPAGYSEAVRMYFQRLNEDRDKP